MRVDSVGLCALLPPGLTIVATAWLSATGCLAQDKAQGMAQGVTQAVTQAAAVDPLKLPDTQLEPVDWADLDGWSADDHAAAFAAFLASCKPLLASGQSSNPRPIYQALVHVCERADATEAVDADQARQFFERNFRPVRIAKLGTSTGLLTGYYEPIVDGSRFPNPEFHWPLYRRPPNMLVNGKKPPSAGVSNRAAVTRRDANNQIVPYYDRLAIENGALDGQHLEICWLRDPLEAMSIEIEGSARVRLEDGTLLRIGYDAHNGFNYASIDQALARRSQIGREELSKERVKRWMEANPEQAKKVRGANRSLVFFRITGLDDERESPGAQGVRLSPGRSIAVDRRVHVYGTPFFIEAGPATRSDSADGRFHRLMVAQDTGSAIVGPARADIYWGAGDAAGRIAGRIRDQGRFAILVPRELDMVAAGKAMPLPLPKPPIARHAAAPSGSTRIR